MKQSKKMKSYRLDEMVIWRIQKTAEEKNMSQTEVIEKAVNLYRFIQSLNEHDMTFITVDWLKNKFDQF